MPSQVVNLKIAGLHTNEQYLGEVPPGALLKCVNFNHDRLGILEKRRGFFVYGNTFATDSDRAKELFTYKDRIFRHYTDKLAYDDGSGNFTEFTGSFTEPSSNLRMKTQEANSNLYITTTEGIKKLDAKSASDISNVQFKDAGGLKALHLEGETDGATGFLSNGNKVGYRITWAYNDRNNNLIIGTPSELLVVENTSGSAANVKLTFPIPSGATSDHFYQIYRSSQVLTSAVVEDELNLVVEDFPTADQLTNLEVVVTDITPDDFREGGTPLYTNAISGTGITSANEPPPLALDITLFKNFTFYANTKTRHNLFINLLSIDDLYDGATKLVISDSTITREYTFDTTEDTGTGQIKRETSGTVAFNVQETAKSIVRVINSDSSSNVNAFYESGVDDVPGQILFERRDLSDVEFSVALTEGDTGEFNPPLAQVTGISAISASNPAVISTVAQSFDSTTDVNPGTDTITITTHGFYTAQEVQASGTLPTGISAATNYYVVRVDANNIQLTLTQDESRQAVPNVVDITATAVGTGTFTATHGLTSGDIVRVTGSDSIPSFDGDHEVTVINDISFSVPVETTGAGTTGEFFKTQQPVSNNEEKSNRIYYSKLQQPEAVPTINFIDIGPQDKAIQRIIGLRDSLFIMKDDGVYRLSGESPATFVVQQFDSSTILIAPDSATVLNNQIYALSSQGVVLISDTGVQIVSKQIENIINDAIQNSNSSKFSFAIASESDRSYYLWTTEKTSDTVATQCFRYNSDTRSWATWDRAQTCGTINPGDDKIYLGASDLNQIEKERKSRDRTDHADRQYDITLGADGVDGTTITKLSSLVNVDPGNVLLQEQYLTLAQYNQLLRQLDLDPQPFTPIVSITTGNPTVIEWTSHSLSTDDYVIISGVTGVNNNLINTSHKVTVLTPDTFSINVDSTLFSWSGGSVKFSFGETLEAQPGDNLNLKLGQLATRQQTYFSDVFADSNGKTGFFGAGASFCYDSTSTPLTFIEYQTVFNLIIDRLNESPDVQLVNYEKSEGTLIYEELVASVDKINGVVTVFTDAIFIEGPMIVFEGIESTVQWVPNHAGDPSIQKRIIDGAVILDNQSFASVEIEYGTDLSQGFAGDEFLAEGIGIFGQTGFGQEGFGGIASSRPIRGLVPRNKSRCRYISPKVVNINAREQIRLFGFNMTMEPISQRAYRGIGIIQR